jgi:asparagine synthase (glutamine-hydrolysing)
VVKPLAFGLAAALPFGPFTKGMKYIQRANIPYPDRLYSYGTYKTMTQAELFEPDFLRALETPYNPYWAIHWHYERARGRTELDRQLYLDLKLAISDNDLFKVCRMTEANGVSVRFPFLDQQLAEFASSVPSEIRMPGLRLRSFFKDAYADLLPVEILKKTKHGFGLPIPVWLRTDKALNELMHDLVLSPRSVQRGFFSRAALERLLAAHRTDTTSFYGTILWNLMVLELWMRRPVVSPPSA